MLDRYGDVPRSRWTHPGLTPGRTTFTSHDEMLRHIEHVEARAPHRPRGTLGRSRQGRETPYLVFTAEGLSDPARIRALNRPIASVAPAGVGREDLPRLTYSPGARARIASA